jgi:hypothetical protein
MTELADAQLRARRRAHIEAALARYPHLTPEGLSELTDYFAREASSLDVGLIACNEDIGPQYRQFRERHIEPLGPRDWLRAAAFVAVMAVILAALFWRAF